MTITARRTLLDCNQASSLERCNVSLSLSHQMTDKSQCFDYTTALAVEPQTHWPMTGSDSPCVTATYTSILRLLALRFAAQHHKRPFGRLSTPNQWCSGWVHTTCTPDRGLLSATLRTFTLDTTTLFEDWSPHSTKGHFPRGTHTCVYLRGLSIQMQSRLDRFASR